jgi:hypothetical protein
VTDEVLLLQMKAHRADWAEIARALGRTEKAVSLRWQLLKERP